MNASMESLSHFRFVGYQGRSPWLVRGAKSSRPAIPVSSTIGTKLISLTGTAVPEAVDRQAKIAGFDQEFYSKAKVLLIGAGGWVRTLRGRLYVKGSAR